MKSHRILVCEDDTLLALDLVSRIEAMGHSALGPAATASDALDLADAGMVDAAIVDLNLADGRSGLALAREMRGRGVPVIVCSGDVLAPSELPDLRHVFVRKPIVERALETCIASVLSRSPATVA